MPLVKAQCTNCGGFLEISASDDVVKCPFCGTPYYLKNENSNKYPKKEEDPKDLAEEARKRYQTYQKEQGGSHKAEALAQKYVNEIIRYIEYRATNLTSVDLILSMDNDDDLVVAESCNGCLFLNEESNIDPEFIKRYDCRAIYRRDKLDIDTFTTAIEDKLKKLGFVARAKKEQAQVTVMLRKSTAAFKGLRTQTVSGYKVKVSVDWS